MRRPIIAAALLLPLLSACGSDEHEDETCVKSHEYTYMMPISHVVGKSVIVTYMPVTETRCDKWIKNGEKSSGSSRHR